MLAGVDIRPKSFCELLWYYLRSIESKRISEWEMKALMLLAESVDAGKADSEEKQSYLKVLLWFKGWSNKLSFTKITLKESRYLTSTIKAMMRKEVPKYEMLNRLVKRNIYLEREVKRLRNELLRFKKESSKNDT